VSDNIPASIPDDSFTPDELHSRANGERTLPQPLDTGQRIVSQAGDGGRTLRVINHFPPVEVVRVALVLLVLAVGVYLLWRIQEVLFLMFLAILLATAIEPIVNRLRRGPFTRGSGVLLVYTAIILVLGLAAYAVVPGLAAEAGAFSDTFPQRLETLRSEAAALQPAPLRDAVIGGLDRVRDTLQAPGGTAGEQIVAVGATAVQSVIGAVSVFVLAFYWLVERATIKRIVLRTVPTHRARNVNTVWLEIEEKLGGWVRGQLILMLVVAVLAGTTYFFVGLPNPVLLAVAAGLFEIIPMIGPFLAFTPAVLVALVTDPSKALIVVACAIVIQQIEGNILVPRVMRHTVGVSPLTVLLGILIGSTLYGLPGAFLAVPIAAGVQVILAHVLQVEDASQAEEHGTPRERTAAQGDSHQAPPQSGQKNATGHDR
jgi:predicted PurR-regulated permease PerM